MRRYSFLSEADVFEALNKLRNAFLAAKDGSEVNQIINSLLTSEEKLQLGRRILIAEGLKQGLTLLDICQMLKVGKGTVVSVSQNLERYPQGFELIEKRGLSVEKHYQQKKYKYVGGSKLIKKKRVYTGITRKDIKR